MPEGVPAAEPGRLVRTELLEAPGGVQGWRVLYHSTSVDGRDIVVSGLVFAPAGPATGPRPIVAWGHGSVGLGDSCAPSRSPWDLIGSSILSELLRRGYVVAATDYEGLGTPGSHPWLVGQSEGRGVLDSVRAARQIPEASAGNRFLAFGASQGGGAVLFAGELAPEYAGELELMGVVAAAPAAELDLLAVLPEGNLTAATGFVVMGAFGFQAAYPDLDLQAILYPDVIAQQERVERLCQEEIGSRFRSRPRGPGVEGQPGRGRRLAGGNNGKHPRAEQDAGADSGGARRGGSGGPGGGEPAAVRPPVRARWCRRAADLPRRRPHRGHPGRRGRCACVDRRPERRERGCRTPGSESLLLRPEVLRAIVDGTVELAFRCWDRPRVKAGTRLRTSVGLVEVLSVDVVTVEQITEDQARLAGSRSRAELVEELSAWTSKGPVHRVRLRFAGPTPGSGCETGQTCQGTT